MKLAALVLVCACGKSVDAPRLSPAAEITGEAMLVAGTRRVAVVGDNTWWQSDAGVLPLDLTQMQRGELVDIFLGADPIVVAGEEHAQTIVRLTPKRVPIEFDGHPTKILTLRNGREAWLVRVGIFDRLVFVEGTQVEEVPNVMVLGPPVEAASPVSKRLCALPKVEDIATSGDAVYALITQCSDDVPIRIVTYPGGEVRRLPSRKELGLAFMKLAVTRDGKPHLAGIHDGRFQIEHVIETKRSTTTFRATRVQTAVAADDGAIWTLVLDADSKPQVLRNGTPVATPSPPKSLALDDKLGVVVLADNVLLAERPGARFVIETHR